MSMCTAFSHSSLPGRPSLSVSWTSRIRMFVHGVYAVHLNSATVVAMPGTMLRWLVLPRTLSKEMFVNKVDVAPSTSLHGNGQ